jgi:hypothetical protein
MSHSSGIYLSGAAGKVTTNPIVVTGAVGATVTVTWTLPANSGYVFPANGAFWITGSAGNAFTNVQISGTQLQVSDTIQSQGVTTYKYKLKVKRQNGPETMTIRTARRGPEALIIDPSIENTTPVQE